MSDIIEPEVPSLKVVAIPAESIEARYIREGPNRRKRKPDDTSRPLTSSTIYDGLSILYNDAQVGALLMLGLPNNPSSGNLHKILLGRGLEKDVDYALFRAKADVHGNNYPPKQRPMVLEKLTDRELKVAPTRASRARLVAREAVARGASDLQMLHAVPHFSKKGPDILVDLPVVRPVVREDLFHRKGGEPNPLDAEADRELREVRLPDLHLGE